MGVSVTFEQVNGALHVPSSKRRPTPAWEARYARKLLFSDAAIVIGSLFAAQVLRYGFASEELQIPVSERNQFALTYSSLSLLLATAWLLALSIWETRSPTAIGTGATEYKRVARATLMTFGMYAIVAFISKAQIGRGYLMIALPAGLFLLLLSRWLWRKRLHRQRARSLNSYRTLIVGEREKVHHVASQIRRDPSAGFDLVAAVTELGTAQDVLPSLPVVANYVDIMRAVDEQNVDTVIITSTDNITPQQLREIGWELETRRISLIVAAALTDIAGPRIHMRPVSGLPLIHVDYPEFTGRKFFAKRVFDLVLSAIGLVLLSPIFLLIAIAVKLSSRGPVFYSQIRIGMNGIPFRMFKFRSMVVGADDKLKSLLDAQGTSDKPLHKIENDPRITPFGRFIRKYSIDELPQIANVFLGNMSLVGPRPQREAEVSLYQSNHARRLMVKPGITGLWQVSGRSNLSWEDAIRLDLYYVENWSMMGDLVLLWRTVKEIVQPTGAH